MRDYVTRLMGEREEFSSLSRLLEEMGRDNIEVLKIMKIQFCCLVHSGDDPKARNAVEEMIANAKGEM